MGIESTVYTLQDWLLPTADHFGGLLVFFISIVLLIFFGLLGSAILSAIRNGPFEAFYSVGRVVVESVPEFFSISPRRVMAMTWLAFHEAVRKKSLYVFAIFLLVMLFAGWFITPGSSEPARLYMSLIFTLSKVLILLLCILITVFSLPKDIESRTIYTIYTKPVLHWEIFLGRLFGYIGIATMVLVAMGLCSYIFLMRGLSHTHQFDGVRMVDQGDGTMVHRTTTNSGHHHKVDIGDDGNGIAEKNNEHSHAVDKIEKDDKDETGPSYFVHGPQNMLRARVRHGGTLRFLDRAGKVEGKTGINVGKEWTYFSYIEGQTFSAAIYTFKLDEDLFVNDTLPLEFNLSVFRTTMGVRTQGVRGSFHFRHPDQKDLRTDPIPFSAKEESDIHYVPRELSNASIDQSAGKLDLLKHLTNDNNEIELWIQCAESSQYFGMAQNSVYILQSESSFTWNFFKCYLSIWFQVVMVVSFGLVFSTFLNGPVSGLASIISLAYGVFAEHLKNFVQGVRGGWHGGGPVEAMVRLFNQKNVMIELGDAAYVPIVKRIDSVFIGAVQVFVHMIPDYSLLDSSLFLIDGYAIPDVVIVQQLLTVMGFTFALVGTGYFFLKTREIAA
ncbi:MAG: hypothetical protein COA78_01180 [Blastopirellula sp.]|nr:MAG: hypothetical protein COA78_01180 [Blastopirellula sp.]